MWVADAALSLSLPALAALGWPAVALWQRTTRTSLDTASAAAAAYAIGLLFVQAGAMLLATCGSLTRTGVLLWLGFGVVCAATIGIHLKAAPSRPRLSVVLGITAALFVAYILMATVPPWYRDEMVYHLALPRAFASARGYVELDDNMFAAMPAGWESILAALHALGTSPDHFPPFNPRLAGAWTMLAAATATVGLARTLGVAEGRARLAAPLVLLVPTFVEFGASAYTEPFLVLLSTLALIATLKYLRGDRSCVFPAGLFAGAAASVKYPGLAVFVFVGLLVAIVTGAREGRFRAYRAAGILAAAGLIFGAGFYVRNGTQRGNPFFPMAFAFFGGKGWDEWRSWALSKFLEGFGEGRGLSDYLALPFRLFTTRQLDSAFEGSLGPIVGLGAIAAVAFPATRSKDRTVLVAASGFVLFWGFFWALTTQQIRFFLVAVPPLIALLLRAAAVLGDRPRWQNAFLAACLAGSTAWTLPPAQNLWDRQRTTDWLLGRIDRETLLRTMLPESYALEPDIEALVPPQGRIWLVWMRNHTYYLRRPHRQDSVFEAYRFESLLDGSRDSASVVASLKADGITHLLIHHALFLWNDNAELRPGRTRTIRERFDALVASGSFKAVRSWGRIVLYEIVAP